MLVVVTIKQSARKKRIPCPLVSENLNIKVKKKREEKGKRARRKKLSIYISHACHSLTLE
jgi:hypothetical protein